MPPARAETTLKAVIAKVGIANTATVNNLFFILVMITPLFLFVYVAINKAIIL